LLLGWRKGTFSGLPLARSVGAPLPEVTRWWSSNLAVPLDQENVGGCIGFGTAGIASTHPFAWRLTNVDGLRAYTIATRIDRGCDPLGSAICKGAYPNADPGSYSPSGMRAGVLLGWFGSWVAVADVPTLIQRLQSGPCGIGMIWYEAEFSPSTAAATCGKLTPSGTVAGGHFLKAHSIVVELQPRRIYLDNSWGNSWGACQGERCGYAYIEEHDLTSLVASGDAEIVCPNPPGGS
jgi:hypothetical protein